MPRPGQQGLPASISWEIQILSETVPQKKFYLSTIWLFNIAMENDPFIDGLPIKNGDFPWLC
jgi:hypothetical protein